MLAELVALIMLGAGDAHEYAKVPGWYITDNDNGSCSMIGTFEGDTSLIVTYNSPRDSVVLAFIDPTYKSLKQGDVRTMKLAFVGPGGRIDHEWGETEYSIGVMKDEARIMTAKYDGIDMLNDIGKNQTIALFYEGSVVESLALKGTSVAVAKLRACAIAESKQHPVDVFEK